MTALALENIGQRLIHSPFPVCMLSYANQVLGIPSYLPDMCEVSNVSSDSRLKFAYCKRQIPKLFLFSSCIKVTFKESIRLYSCDYLPL